MPFRTQQIVWEFLNLLFKEPIQLAILLFNSLRGIQWLCGISQETVCPYISAAWIEWHLHQRHSAFLWYWYNLPEKPQRSTNLRDQLMLKADLVLAFESCNSMTDTHLCVSVSHQPHQPSLRSDNSEKQIFTSLGIKNRTNLSRWRYIFRQHSANAALEYMQESQKVLG